MAPSGHRHEKNLKDVQKDLADKGFTLSTIPGENAKSILSVKLFSDQCCDDQSIIISLGQILAGLPIPLYNPDIPLFYEILAHPGFS